MVPRGVPAQTLPDPDTQPACTPGLWRSAPRGREACGAGLRDSGRGSWARRREPGAGSREPGSGRGRGCRGRRLGAGPRARGWAGPRVEGGRGPGAVSGCRGNGRRAHLAVVQRERHQVRRGCAAAHGRPLDALHGGARARPPALRMPSARGAGRRRARGGPCPGPCGWDGGRGAFPEPAGWEPGRRRARRKVQSVERAASGAGAAGGLRGDLRCRRNLGILVARATQRSLGEGAPAERISAPWGRERSRRRRRAPREERWGARRVILWAVVARI